MEDGPEVPFPGVPACVLSRGTPWTVARQASLPTGFPRREYWSGWPFPSPGDLPEPEIKPALVGGFFTTEPGGRPLPGVYTLYNPLPLSAGRTCTLDGTSLP